MCQELVLENRARIRNTARVADPYIVLLQSYSLVMLSNPDFPERHHISLLYYQFSFWSYQERNW